MEPFVLRIELKRVQSFIFDVPRLKAMLGANALIGETMRLKLTELAMNSAGIAKLAWPSSLKLDKKGDPLHDDNPEELFSKGILARDGGHFITVFETKHCADEFLKAAAGILSNELPGVRYDAEIMPLGHEHGVKAGNKPDEIHLLDLPVLQVCKETGRDVASSEENFPLETRKRAVSASAKARIKAGDKFYGGYTQDIIGLMRAELYPDQAMKWSRPTDLKDLAAGGYIALIHADGNGIGARFNQWRDHESEADVVEREARGETFFHSMRVAVRRSIVGALRSTFVDKGGTRPYEVLMLGGDDLLLVCRADKALSFALNYAQELQCHILADGKRLDVALGVAIARHTYPVHRLHELAESLASSAKRLYRGLDDGDKTSVIDWQVVSQSWFEDVARARRNSERIRYRVDDQEESLLLTGRPYRVLCGEDSLRRLLTSVSQLSGGSGVRAARSPLRSLRRACEAGRLSGEMAFDRFDEGVRLALGGKLWRRLDNEHWLTRTLDVIGIREIAQLGAKRHE